MSQKNSTKSENTPPNATSLSLIDQLKDNRADAWQRLYALYAPLVSFWCSRAGVPQQEINDLVQDVFQTVARSIAGFSIRRPSDTFRGWLRTITNSRVVDWRRRNSGKPQATGGSTAQMFFAGQPFDNDLANAKKDDESRIEKHLTQQLYTKALEIIREHFQERTWKAFCRVVIDGLTPKEAGQELSMTPSAVRVAKSRVLHRLRAELGELGDADPTLDSE